MVLPGTSAHSGFRAPAVDASEAVKSLRDADRILASIASTVRWEEGQFIADQAALLGPNAAIRARATLKHDEDVRGTRPAAETELIEADGRVLEAAAHLAGHPGAERLKAAVQAHSDTPLAEAVSRLHATVREVHQQLRMHADVRGEPPLMDWNDVVSEDLVGAGLGSKTRLLWLVLAAFAVIAFLSIATLR